MKRTKILRSFLSVIPLLGMGFLLNAHTHVDATAHAEIKRAYENFDFSEQKEVSIDEKLAVSIVSSNTTPTSHSFEVTFKAGGEGYSTSTRNFVVASTDPEFYEYIDKLNAMELEDREALIKKIEEGEETAPLFDGYITKINGGGSTDGEVIIPQTFTRNGLFNCDIKEIYIAAVEDWSGIQSITIPKSVDLVYEYSFDNAPEGIVFNLEHDSQVPQGWDPNWLPAGCTANINYDYQSLPDRSKNGRQSTQAIAIDTENLNYILGYYPTDTSKELPLIMEYELNEQPGVKKYFEFKNQSSSTNYNSVGELSESFISLNCDILLGKNESVNKDTLVIRNIYPAIKEDNAFVPDVNGSTGYYISPLKSYKNEYKLDEFITYSFDKVSNFCGYFTVGMNIDIVQPTVYQKLNKSYYNNNLANIEAGKTEIRYRISRLSSWTFDIAYKVGDTVVNEIIPVSTPIQSTKLNKINNNNIVFLINQNMLPDDFDVKNIVGFQINGLAITVDLYIAKTNSIIARSNATTRFSNVVVYDGDTGNGFFDVDLMLIIVAISYIVGYAAIATGLYLYLKNKFKNDEFRRIKTGNYVKKATIGLVGLGIVIFEFIFIALRFNTLSNAIVVFNPVDAFIIGFGIASVLCIGYFIKELITTIKAEKQRRTTIKLQLDKDVDDDGTN